jgi:hypothetical protein
MNKISKKEVIVENQEEKQQISTLTGELIQKSKNTLKTQLKNAFRWGLISLLVLEGLVTGIWTFIPTALLPWGASGKNYLGYVSHCSFAPISTILLFGLTAIGIVMIIRKPKIQLSGIVVSAVGVVGTGIGLISGISMQSLMLSALSVGIGLIIGIFVCLVKK